LVPAEKTQIVLWGGQVAQVPSGGGVPIPAAPTLAQTDDPPGSERRQQQLAVVSVPQLVGYGQSRQVPSVQKTPGVLGKSAAQTWLRQVQVAPLQPQHAATEPSWVRMATGSL
jgi:hypothetical protein